MAEAHQCFSCGATWIDGELVCPHCDNEQAVRDDVLELGPVARESGWIKGQYGPVRVEPRCACPPYRPVVAIGHEHECPVRLAARAPLTVALLRALRELSHCTHEKAQQQTAASYLCPDCGAVGYVPQGQIIGTKWELPALVDAVVQSWKGARER
jgi:predicted RNA-binding Zn-ribbon protein involved in translation (DUF1610 family)